MNTTPKPLSVTRRKLVKAAALGAVGAALVPASAHADSVADKLDSLFSTGAKPADAVSYLNSFTALLDEKGLTYTVLDDGHSLRIGYYGDYLDSVDVIVVFDADGDPYVHFMSWSIGASPQDLPLDALTACNNANNKFYWAKFSVDSDGDYEVAVDAIIDAQTCAQETYELLTRMVSIIDDASVDFPM